MYNIIGMAHLKKVVAKYIIDWGMDSFSEKEVAVMGCCGEGNGSSFLFNISGSVHHVL